MINVVIGRFQVPNLHEGHQALFAAIPKHERLIVFLGVAPVPNADNPLSFDAREAMMKNALCEFERLTVLPLEDIPGGTDPWVGQLQDILAGTFGSEDWTFYGGRDSCLPILKEDDLRTIEVISVGNFSGTKVRQAPPLNDVAAFRRGVIYAYQNDPR